ncbi:rod shape-determining protein MreC [Croceitalea sp. MTPC5]|uniref:rod shape-determining protein MreC n=1 Tax=Croceitalea sp. MTPC5 TaxID=3056565 RepID=UPI002B39C6B0|nr:rod shape-determining protein MreC [Croceitalea sp. MTPC5]
MQRIINFILNYRNSVLYFFLLIVSLTFTIRSHSYHQSYFFNSSKWFTGSVYNVSSNITSYFNLEEENQRLSEENEKLRNQLFNTSTISDSIKYLRVDFEVVHARIVKNSYASPRNYITIDKGDKDGISQDMGVITTKGILGIVENTSANFATVQSILNTKSTINAKIKNTNYFGSLKWDAKNFNVVQLIDIPRLVPLTVGDTIVTGSMSSIFPENIPIGVIKKYNLNQAQSSYNIDVTLFNNMANLKNIYIVKNKNRKEVLELEKTILNAE